MTGKELQDLRIGDIVIISTHGQNKGKRGQVDDIIRGSAYLRPLDGEFTFYNQSSRTKNENGLYRFAHETIQVYPRKEKPLALQIYRFIVGIGYGDENWISVICTNEDDAFKMIYQDVLKHVCEEDITITFKDIIPFTYGTII